MDLKRPNKLRLSGKSETADAPAIGGEAGLPEGFSVNEVAELVADLIEATGLVSGGPLPPPPGRGQRGRLFRASGAGRGRGDGGSPRAPPREPFPAAVHRPAA